MLHSEPIGDKRRGLRSAPIIPRPPAHQSKKEYTEVEGAIADERCTTTPA